MGIRSSFPAGGKILATPDQASKVFNSNGLAPIRQKHLFLVRFLRRNLGTDDQWKDGLSFVVKSIDRPAVKPVLEELNQYNRKRQIQTGVKYDPVNLTIYDTVDSSGGSGAAMKMWLEYAAYHFGDYNHAESPNDFADDIYDLEMHNTSGGGFGFKLPRKVSLGGETGEQFFFNGLEVLQVHGGKYVKYTLVNPRISSFTPDELDYGNSEAATISMQVSYEAIVHHANGQAQSLDAATVSVYKELLKATGENTMGSPFDLTNPFPNTSPAQTTTPIAPSEFDAAAAYMKHLGVKQPPIMRPLEPLASGSNGGVLERFGEFDFGNTSALLDGLPSEVSLSGGELGGAIGTANMAHLDPAVMRGIYGASKEMGLTIQDVALNDDGVTLNPAALALANQAKDGTSQIGFRRSPDNLF